MKLERKYNTMLFGTGSVERAKEDGLHTAIESCNFAGRETIDKVFKYVDLGLLDIKHIDCVKHKRLNGVLSEPILYT